MRWIQLIACLALGSALGGCAGNECDFNTQCGVGFYCRAGACGQDCLRDVDCDPGLVCNEIGQCRAPDAGPFDAGPFDAGTGPDPVPDAGDSGPRPDAGPVDSGPPGSDAGFDGGAGVDGGGGDAGFDAGFDGGFDAGFDGGFDAGFDGGFDAGFDGGFDAGFDGGFDAGPPPGAYLDRCVVGADCASGRCVDDRGGTRFCSRTCTSHTQCASEQLCASGQCVPNDVGTRCSGASGCSLGLCAGNPATSMGECSRSCTTAADCPAGYGCTNVGGVFLCIDIERPCAQCPTGLCLGALGFPAVGCTATCRSPADCPTTFAGLPYSCTSGVCVPHRAIVGSDPIPGLCRMSGPSNLCRSGACIDDFASTSRCTERCTEVGGCGPGLGCVPADDGGGGVVLLCQGTGSLDLTEACTSDGQCISGLCHATGRFCTRLCTTDGVCPTGLVCRPAAGVSICSP